MFEAYIPLLKFIQVCGGVEKKKVQAFVYLAQKLGFPVDYDFRCF